MKFSEAWLREWVNPPVTTDELVSQLTNAGLEVDRVSPLGGGVRGVVVAHIVRTRPHPAADRLTVCEVSTGEDDTFEVVCGAPNAGEGLRSAFAAVGTRIADGTTVRRTAIRGVESHGMLCSARELGLGEEHDGILELPADAPLGQPLVEYLALDDTVIELELTPNRGECLSVAGIAREVGALNRVPMVVPDIPRVKSTIGDRFPVSLEAPANCPRYVGRVIRGIDPEAATPLWMHERLRRCGVRPISPVVDITNYVMLELGQPMHAFDCEKLVGGIRVRKAREGERLRLLDEREVELHPTTLVIADERRAVALAGIMGGLDTAVGEGTRDIFLESAFFSPTTLSGQARHYGLHTDASHRFERGVDPELQRRAAERATALLLDVVGGEPGPVVDEVSAPNMPRRGTIRLRRERLERLLGMRVEPATVSDVLDRLGMVVGTSGEDWNVVPPSYRFDLEMEADLIEEVARLTGYDAVPSVSLAGAGRAPSTPERAVRPEMVRRSLTARGYHEAVSYSFVEAGLQRELDPLHAAIPLANPISQEMAVMRTSMWPGLLQALLHNVHRQQSRVRLFEIGLVFRRRGGDPQRPGTRVRGFEDVGDVVQIPCLGGLVTGPVVPEQWGEGERLAGFFDAKGDVESVLRLTRRPDAFRFVPEPEHSALHPGQAARIELDGETVGRIGALHPRLQQAHKLPSPVLVFELALSAVAQAELPRFEPVSRFPAVRRDIAVIVDEAVAADALRASIAKAGPDVLQNLEFFDVYRGEGIDSGKKSVAIGLTFQARSRTLNDDEIEHFVQGIVSRLASDWEARLRG